MDLSMDFPIVAHYATVLGRVLIGFYFFFFVFWNTYHRKAALEVMRQHLPFAPVFLAVGIIMEACMGLLIIFAQFTAIAAVLLIIFVIFATLIFHRFWTIKEEPAHTLNTIIFIGNFTITLGALLLLVGSGG
jgi:putative oxidoreductase